jgi:hypothetical protein
MSSYLFRWKYTKINLGLTVEDEKYYLEFIKVTESYGHGRFGELLYAEKSQIYLKK